MQRAAGLALETGDLVAEYQFAALEFDDPEIVGGEMHESFVQFRFQNLVLAFQFDEMRL